MFETNGDESQIGLRFLIQMCRNCYRIPTQNTIYSKTTVSIITEGGGYLFDILLITKY